MTTYAYDPTGQMLSITDARGIKFVENFSSPSGRVVRQVQADGGEWRFRYFLRLGATSEVRIARQRLQVGFWPSSWIYE